MNINISYDSNELANNKDIPLDKSYILIKGNKLLLYYGMIYGDNGNEMSYETLNTPYQLVYMKKDERGFYGTDKQYYIETDDIYIPFIFFNLTWYQYLILKFNNIIYNHTAIVIAIFSLIVAITSLCYHIMRG
ncbi:hypothetical protein [Galbibacter pacificus]|uniref:Uncharacterized protein n=1 Tax=Galbibacter pacificus TaxID=2996052 RepID=A0ABT6FRB5_9FLAO|nr:hypothetical protein [Galbibacter pacificus]MDG3581751.1 hypothetical protein [Galbibacter pacificus]MDG3585775.1 hypothetical protein [Galbibacter pacificus]